MSAWDHGSAAAAGVGHTPHTAAGSGYCPSAHDKETSMADSEEFLKISDSDADQYLLRCRTEVNAGLALHAQIDEGSTVVLAVLDGAPEYRRHHGCFPAHFVNYVT